MKGSRYADGMVSRRRRQQLLPASLRILVGSKFGSVSPAHSSVIRNRSCISSSLVVIDCPPSTENVLLTQYLIMLRFGPEFRRVMNSMMKAYFINSGKAKDPWARTKPRAILNGCTNLLPLGGRLISICKENIKNIVKIYLLNIYRCKIKRLLKEARIIRCGCALWITP